MYVSCRQEYNRLEQCTRWYGGCILTSIPPFPSPYPLSILFQSVFLARRVNFPRFLLHSIQFESRRFTFASLPWTFATRVIHVIPLERASERLESVRTTENNVTISSRKIANVTHFRHPGRRLNAIDLVWNIVTYDR